MPAHALAAVPTVDYPAVERLGDEIAALAARIHAATYELLVLLRQFDEQNGWNTGFTSCAHWLTWRTGIDLGAAREKVRVARALADLPHLSAAMRRGELSYSKVRAVTRVATPDNERRLLEVAQCGTTSQVERIVRAWRHADRIEAAHDARRQHLDRHLQAWVDDDGMLVIRGRLTPEAGAVVQRALEAAAERLYQEARDADPEATDEVTAGQRRADAMALLAESALSADLDRGTAGERYQVVVHVEADALAAHGTTGPAVLEGPEGQRVSAETSRRLACDASIVTMRHAHDGAVLDVGRRTRTIPPAIRRALAARDRHCRFPGCTARHADAHHVQHWADGGDTRLDNLLLLCRRHHRLLHEEGWQVGMGADATVRFVRPDGRPLPTVPPTSLRGVECGPPLSPVEESLAAAGIEIDAWTATPAWLGERLDVGWAIDVLRSRPS